MRPVDVSDPTYRGRMFDNEVVAGPPGLPGSPAAPGGGSAGVGQAGNPADSGASGRTGTRRASGSTSALFSPAGTAAAPGARPGGFRAVEVDAWRERLAQLDEGVADTELVEQLRTLEELKAAACAAQARIAVTLDGSQRAAQARVGVPAERRGQGVGAQVALARRESPSRGGRLLGLAKALVGEMPCTLAALQAGVLSEWRATLLVRESACLSVEQRAVFDREVAGNVPALEGLGDKRLVTLARRVAYRLDPEAVVDRARRAPSERCVSLRPAPETMSYLTALLPVAHGVGVLAALTRQADVRKAEGDPRSRSQIMADTLVERLTGQTGADAVPVEVHVVMTDRALLAGDAEPAVVPGYGTVPAQWARDLIVDRLTPAPEAHGARTPPARSGAVGDATSRDARVAVWLRRLFTAPTTGQLVAMDSRRRLAPRGLAAFVATRDQTCRTPWCDAPIRHHDHIIPAAHGGRTTADNLQGTCEACNYAKTAPGWTARTVTGDPPGETGEHGHAVETTTPAGHRYVSRAPALPGLRPPSPPPHNGGDNILERYTGRRPGLGRKSLRTLADALR